uniref:Uncharacterized protein n=1 Tax=Anguilla anguilla TaxID=7936 RepID=A0A0E9U9Z6_ANGAN
MNHSAAQPVHCIHFFKLNLKKILGLEVKCCKTLNHS